MMKQVGNKKSLFIIIILCWFVLTCHSVIAQEGDDTQQKYVSIDFKDVDIRVFIKFISELTNENFIIDNKVKGNVNILSPDKITIEEAYKVFESVLEVHGFTPVKAGKITKIIPSPLARSKNVETRLKKIGGPGGDKIITQLIPLKYANVNELKALFVPLISRGSVILAYSPTNTLIITDVFSNIQRLLKIIGAIDVEAVGRQLSIIPIEHADARILVKTLTTLFRAAKATKRKKIAINVASEFVADERTNIILMLADEFNTLKAKKLVAALDKKVPKSDAKIHVYYLENAKAEDLATVLQSLSGKTAVKDKGKKKAPVVSDKVKITADKATNSLIIMADKDDYTVLETIIQKLDIVRPMVYIEALIMEVRVTDGFDFGVEWAAGDTTGTIQGEPAFSYGGYKTQDSIIPSIADGVASLPSGFSLGLLAAGIKVGGITFPTMGAAIKAMQKDDNYNVLSTPQIMTMNNEEAKILVGENVPYITRSESSSVDLTREYETYEYKDVGVTLKITPQINQERFVTLKIFQEVIKVADDSIAFRPTTLKRVAETTVVVKDATTVVIGGLIGEDLSSGSQQVPCLGDISGIGNLFKSKGRSGTKTNLYIFITPHIITNPAEAEKIYQEKNEEINKFKQETIKLYKDVDILENLGLSKEEQKDHEK
jgi:general secretion pathway protein D